MKKYNKFSLKWFAIGSIALALSFLCGMNGVYAYFSATASYIASSVSTGSVKIEVSTNATGLYSSGTVVTTSNLVPGDYLGFDATIENTGSGDIYVIVKVVVTVTGDGESTGPDSAFYNLSGDLIDTSLTTQTVGASVITASDSSNFVFSYLLTGAVYGNAYKLGTADVEFYVYAIQYKHVDSATEATELLLKYFNK